MRQAHFLSEPTESTKQNWTPVDSIMAMWKEDDDALCVCVGLYAMVNKWCGWSQPHSMYIFYSQYLNVLHG